MTDEKRYLLSNQYKRLAAHGADYEPEQFSDLEFHSLFKQAALFLNDKDAQEVLRVCSLVKLYHLDSQLRRNGDLYYTHPFRVANKLLREKAEFIHSWEDIRKHVDLRALKARLLHDVVEDTHITLEDLSQFGIDHRTLDDVHDLTRIVIEEDGVIIFKEAFSDMMRRIGMRGQRVQDSKSADMMDNRASNDALPENYPFTPKDLLKHDFYEVGLAYNTGLKVGEIEPGATMREFAIVKSNAVGTLSPERVSQVFDQYSPEDSTYKDFYIIALEYANARKTREIPPRTPLRHFVASRKGYIEGLSDERVQELLTHYYQPKAESAPAAEAA